MNKPKYNYKDTVSFKLGDKVFTGVVYIIDAHGTFECPEEVSYDIMVTKSEGKTLYKHIRESWLIDKE